MTNIVYSIPLEYWIIYTIGLFFCGLIIYYCWITRQLFKIISFVYKTQIDQENGIIDFENSIKLYQLMQKYSRV
jgi:hypothetical protein